MLSKTCGFKLQGDISKSLFLFKQLNKSLVQTQCRGFMFGNNDAQKEEEEQEEPIRRTYK